MHDHISQTAGQTNGTNNYKSASNAFVAYKQVSENQQAEVFQNSTFYMGMWAIIYTTAKLKR